jgi:hypothetical protein
VKLSTYLQHDREVDDLVAICDTLEAIAAEGRKEMERRKQNNPQGQ